MDPQPQQQCIFCQITQGKINTQKVYEDSDIVAVLDINPANPGHCLVITRAHYQVMPQIPDEIVVKMMDVTRKISHASLSALKAQGTVIFVANGAAAGQRAPHFMLHVIPRVPGDGLTFDIPKKDYSLQEFAEIKKKIYERVTGVVGSQPVLEQLPVEVPAQDVKVVVEQKPLVEQEPSKEQEKSFQFIWQKPSGAHFDIKGLPVYDTANVTRFLARHKELVTVVESLASKGSMHTIELLRIVDFRTKYLFALEYLGYIRPLGESDPLLSSVGKERKKNHPGRTFYAVTIIGRQFISNPSKPPVLSNAVKEKVLLEEMDRPALPHETVTHKPIPPPPKQNDKPDFDLDRLTEMLGGR